MTSKQDEQEGGLAGASSELVREEDLILESARVIRRQRDLARSTPWKDPDRNTTHWDQLLAEMKWMSTDFARERKWRLNQCRTFGRRASRASQEGSFKGKLSQKEQEARDKKRCAAVSREVMRFWKKAERVVNFKIQQSIEWRKQEMLNKHLHFLIGQTERYSSMLAENLTQAQEPFPSPQPLPPPQEKTENGDGGGGGGGESSMAQKPLLEGSMGQLQNGVRNSKDRTRSCLTDDRPAKRVRGDGAKLSARDEDGGEPLSGSDGPSTSSIAEDKQNDAVPVTVDDGTVLTREPRAGEQNAGGSSKQKKVTFLQDELSDPPKNSAKQHAMNTADDCTIEPTTEPDEAPAVQENDKVHSNEENNETHRLPNGVKNEDNGDSGADLHDPGGGQSDTLHDQMLDKEKGGEEDEEDYKVDDGKEPEDDETTLAEQERLESKGGGAGQESELQTLDEEAELPLEELLKRYNVHVSEDCQVEANEMDVDEGGSDMEEAEEKEDADDDQEPPTENNTKTETEPKLEELAENGNSGDPDTDILDSDLHMVSKAASSAQPSGNTLSTCEIGARVPFLLKHTLREYQHIGLDWLVTLYKKKINGILADEMGLGKTIQTISLLAWLACEEGVWGPHLIVVPTSVMLNWEMEFKKWCPAFKLLTYYGSAKERKAKRQGWSKPNAFHVCITSYTLILQDAKMFRRKKWKYLILDEAHMIKNWKSQRWQTLLNFNSKRRLLLTGTPLQNDLMELWSLMHFLMPHVFSSHAQFKDWFCNPLTGMVRGKEQVNHVIVDRLHGVLRPFLLRRLKVDVEKQLPQKHEHVVYCRFSKRQRKLYEEYMASSETKSTLASGNFLGIINVLMQLRKVCNHPDLFAGRPIVSPWDLEQPVYRYPSSIVCVAQPDSPWHSIDFASMKLCPAWNEHMTRWESEDVAQLRCSSDQIIRITKGDHPEDEGKWCERKELISRFRQEGVTQAALDALMHSMQKTEEKQKEWRMARAQHACVLNGMRCCQAPVYGADMRKTVSCSSPIAWGSVLARENWDRLPPSIVTAVKSFEQRAIECDPLLKAFLCSIPKVRLPPPACWCSKPSKNMILRASNQRMLLQREYRQRNRLLWTSLARTQMFFPDKRLVQFDCGKLQELALLLRRLRSGGHRALIFTQMSKMLDILEVFLNIHGFTYMRLDGSTKPEQRQILMQRFNNDNRTFVFILSTRSGGVGVNLTGADTVIFYDSDWNPAMDQQAQDRCHRIGQTREVHIYRLVTEHSIEENILRKSDEKRQLDFLAIQSGGFNLQFLQKLNPSELLGGSGSAGLSAEDIKAAMRSAEDDADADAAVEAEQEAAAELEEFTMDPPQPQIDPDSKIPDPESTELPQSDPPDPKPDQPMPVNDSKMEVDAENGNGKSGKESDSVKGSADEGKEEGSDGGEEVEGFGGMNEGMLGSDQMNKLMESFTPVEKYAVMFIEQMSEPVDVEAAAVQLVSALNEEEWELDAIEEQKEELEQEIDFDEEGRVVDSWDKDAATKEYVAEVEAAQKQAEEEKKRAEELMAMLESMPQAPEPEVGQQVKRAKVSNGSKAPKRQRPSSPSMTVTDSDSSSSKPYTGRKRPKTNAIESIYGRLWSKIHVPTSSFPHPWRVNEDLALSFLVKHVVDGMLLETGLVGRGLKPPEGVWAAASEVLEKGVADEDDDIDEDFPVVPPGRSPYDCKMRYNQLIAACVHASSTNVHRPPAQSHSIQLLKEFQTSLSRAISSSMTDAKAHPDVSLLWQEVVSRDGSRKPLVQYLHALQSMVESTVRLPESAGLNNVKEDVEYLVPSTVQAVLSTVQQAYAGRGSTMDKRLVAALSDMDKMATSGVLQQAIRLALKGIVKHKKEPASARVDPHAASNGGSGRDGRARFHGFDGDAIREGFVQMFDPRRIGLPHASLAGARQPNPGSFPRPAGAVRPDALPRPLMYGMSLPFSSPITFMPGMDGIGRMWQQDAMASRGGGTLPGGQMHMHSHNPGNPQQYRLHAQPGPAWHQPVYPTLDRQGGVQHVQFLRPPMQDQYNWGGGDYRQGRQPQQEKVNRPVQNTGMDSLESLLNKLTPPDQRGGVQGRGQPAAPNSTPMILQVLPAGRGSAPMQGLEIVGSGTQLSKPSLGNAGQPPSKQSGPWGVQRRVPEAPASGTPGLSKSAEEVLRSLHGSTAPYVPPIVPKNSQFNFERWVSDANAKPLNGAVQYGGRMEAGQRMSGLSLAASQGDPGPPGRKSGQHAIPVANGPGIVHAKPPSEPSINDPLIEKLKEMGLRNVTVRELGSQMVQQRPQAQSVTDLPGDWALRRPVLPISEAAPPGLRLQPPPADRSVSPLMLSSFPIIGLSPPQSLSILMGGAGGTVPQPQMSLPNPPANPNVHPPVLIMSSPMPSSGGMVQHVLVPISLAQFAAYQPGVNLPGLSLLPIQRLSGDGGAEGGGPAVSSGGVPIVPQSSGQQP